MWLLEAIYDRVDMSVLSILNMFLLLTMING